MSVPMPAAADQRNGARWFEDWQQPAHARHFDERSVLDRANLVRNYERFNDVRMCGEQIERLGAPLVLEVGCATGEFYRYLSIRHPRAEYVGLDISSPAIARAKQKYPAGRFVLSDPERSLAEQVQGLALTGRPDILYSKDVLHHHAAPFGFLKELLAMPASVLILRTRTRDRGETVLDPEQSCQYHYQGWMPYIVFNLDELVSEIHVRVPAAEVLVRRHHMVLGGRENRYLPKPCYLPETGTAETAVVMRLDTAPPGRVSVLDQPEPSPVYTLTYRLKRRLLQNAH